LDRWIWLDDANVALGQGCCAGQLPLGSSAGARKEFSRRRRRHYATPRGNGELEAWAKSSFGSLFVARCFRLLTPRRMTMR
jgi:hypothetical protein